jgi:predicted HAD superfamily Cof-like phosphohydrolase
MEDIADALEDLLYLILGTFIELGLQDLAEPMFVRVHESNMSKLGADGKPIYREDGKVLKGPGYFAPELGKMLS